MNAAIQALVVPQAVSANVFGAVSLTVNVTYTVYVKASSNLSPAVIQTNISNALGTYFAGLPIGGLVINGSGIVPLDAIVSTIFGSNAGTVDLTVFAPTADTPLALSQVPVLGTVLGAVVLV